MDNSRNTMSNTNNFRYTMGDTKTSVNTMDD